MRNNKFFLASFFILMVSAVFVRTYNFHDWLYFKMDQARDANIISQAIKNGPGDLPLLGPRAGATEVSSGFLRLGPAFYYFQYLSGKIFNSVQPEIFAYPDLFFSILTIPLLYLFSRFYFKRKTSFLVASMYAFSFIVIQYSRFAWNPNSLLFFTLLAFYGMLKFLRAEKLNAKIGWVVVWSAGIAIGSQLHFLGLFCLPAISAVILILHYEPWKKTNRLDWKNNFLFRRVTIYLLAFIAVFAFVYSPVIISEVIRKGENTKDFLQAFSTKPGKKPLAEKISSSLDDQTKYYCLITTSECYKRKVKDNIGFSFLTVLVMLSGLILTIVKIRKEKEATKKDFLNLLLIWFGIFFLIAIPLYASLRPRFFIAVFPIPFIFLGLLMEFFEEKSASKGKYLTIITTAIILSLNAQGTLSWFKEQSESQKRNLTIDRTLILKNQDGVTLGQLEKAVDYMYKAKNPDTILHYYVKQEHFSPIKYLFSQKNDPSLIQARVEKDNNLTEPYFAVVPSDKKASTYIPEEFGEVKILDSYNAGQIAVYKIQSNTPQNTVDKNSQNPEPSDSSANSQSDRVFWRDIFGGNSKEDIQVDDSDSSDLPDENSGD